MNNCESPNSSKVEQIKEMKQNDGAFTSTESESTVPMQLEKAVTFFGWKYRNYFSIKSSLSELTNPEIKNIYVSCNLCPQDKRPYSTAKNTTSNLLKHLNIVHSNTKLVLASEPDIMDITESPAKATKKTKLNDIISKHIKMETKPTKRKAPITSIHQGNDDIDAKMMSVIDTLIEQGRSRIMPFFVSITPTVDSFSDEETVNFQYEVMKLIKDITARRQ